MPDDPNALSKITINGQEFDINEAQELIETGRKTRELETKYNTKLDSVWPSYTRTTQEKAALEKERDELKAKIATFDKQKEVGEKTPTDITEAKKALKNLNVVLEDELDTKGFIKKADLDSYLSEREQKREEQKQQTDKVLAEANEVITKLKGTDLPKVSSKALIGYAYSYGFQDMQKAYEDMFPDETKAWKDSQIKAQKAKSLETIKPGGTKLPSQPRISRDNLMQNLRETLWTSEE